MMSGGKTETIENDPIKRFIITNDIALPQQSLKAKALIVQKDNKFYIIVGWAPKETFTLYEQDILVAMNSVRFKNGKEWRTYSPPYKSYGVKMPSTPFYWQGKFKANSDDETVTNQHVLNSSVLGAISRYYVYHWMLDSPPNEKEQKSIFSDVMKIVKKKGKVIFADQIHEDGALKLKFKIKNKDNKIADGKMLFIDANAYLMEVDQDTNSYDEVNAKKFFESFQKTGDPINVVSVLDTSAQKKSSYAKSGEAVVKGALSGNMKDQNEIGNFYLNRNPRTEQDLTEAFKWFQKAAGQNYPNAINNIGIMFENGWSVQKDKSEAEKWYRKAADLGLDVAQNNLGVLYLANAKTPEDFARALQLFLSAAKNGNKNAAYNLGLIYENGILGIPINYKEADYWYGKVFE